MLKPEAEIYILTMKTLSVLSEANIFIGDGSSNELYEVNTAEMKTISTEYLISKSKSQKEQIIHYIYYYVNSFNKIVQYID